MNILDLANIRPPRNVAIIRKERIKREGSPSYTWHIGVVAGAATSAIYVPDQFPESRKYTPLDFITLTNNDAVDLMLTINGSDTYFTPAGTITTIRNVGLWHIQIENLHATQSTVTKKIYATLQKEPQTIDKWAQKQ